MKNNYKRWTTEEDNFLRIYYEQEGVNYCSHYLNRTNKAILLRGQKLKINSKHHSKKYKYSEEIFSEIVKNSETYLEIVKSLGLSINSGANIQTIKKYIKKYNLDVSHIEENKIRRNLDQIKKLNEKHTKDLSEILVENSTYNRAHLKNRLYKEGLKKRKCELCGQGEKWKGKHMSLILDHINGINNDHRLENLRIVCPNCNSTLDTHGGKQMKKHPKKECLSCFKLTNNDKFCSTKCNGDYLSTKNHKYHNIKNRKVDRPSYNQLKKDLEETTCVAVGKKYGVSNKAIKKWMAYYEKYGE